MKVATSCNETVTIPLNDTGAALSMLRMVIHRAKPEHFAETLVALRQMEVFITGKMVAGEPPAEQFLTMEQVAECLNLPKTYCYELARQGKLPSVKIGKYVRVPASGLADYRATVLKKIA